jgi:hypothetical protein
MKYFGRKFLSVSAFTLATIAGLFIGKLTGAEFVTMAGLLIGTFTAGDVILKTIGKGKQNVDSSAS